uniref:zinc finger BED domain-containing protein DAYSLEEPER-like isoform X1 n=1 Tax=Fragaria vesca subsp. vesca TaxID=101020 RepID=UPI0005C8F87F|nr:PREDICTED: zinc finger BED domain-containing protein DAYSLEEPER-like isoform X1 [Fragaria vesca subsp. vesca]
MATPVEEKLVTPFQEKTTPVEEPVTTPVQEPNNTPVEKPVTNSVEEHVTNHVEEPVTIPVEEPVTNPVEEPVTTTVEEPVTATVEEPVTATVEEPVTATVEEPVTATVEEPVTTTVEESVTTTVEESVTTTIEESVTMQVDTTPVDESVTTPADERMSTPIEEPATLPVEEPMTAPVKEPMPIQDEEPVPIQVQVPVPTPMDEPMSTPIQDKMNTQDEGNMPTHDEEKMLSLTQFEEKTETPYANNEGIHYAPVDLTPYANNEMTPYVNHELTHYANHDAPLANNELTTYENTEGTNPEAHPNKRRKKKSVVWEHFTIENVSPGCRRACCKQCKQSFAYSTGSKVAGTSHLKRHIAKGTCPALLRNQDKNQSSPYTPATRGGSTANTPKRRYRTANSPQFLFDPDRCRHEIAKMIIMHDYPLHMVEHPGFVTFVQNLQPHFNMVSFNTVQGDCVATYLTEKQNLNKFIEGIPGRVCLTLDMWTSSQSVGYVFITGHFIDADWKLHRRLLNVVMEPYPDSDSVLSHAVAVCLHDWSLESKLFSITYDHPVNEAALENLRPLLPIKNPLILNGQLLVGNCVARTLSSIAKEVLEAGRDVVKKVRDSVKYVKTSESHEEKFVELKEQLQVPSERSISLDDQTKWNTTYQMLVAASELKEVFSCLDTSDPDYKQAPSMEDWKQVETLCTYLKLIFDASNILTTTTSPTAVTFFHEVWRIQSDLARAITTEDPFVSNLAKKMQERIEKYWKKCCLALATAVVMDPRFKMKLVEFSFNKVYGEEAPTFIKIVDDGIHELFHEYLTLPLPLTPAYAEEGNAGGNTRTEDSQGGTTADNGLTDFDVYIMETTSQQMKSELDQYLEEALLPRVHEFDVLGWWKLNKMKYPTLSKMARDILSIPVSTVSSDSVFDNTANEMDQYRSSLRPETLEAVICAKDWMQYGSAQVSDTVVRMEY